MSSNFSMNVAGKGNCSNGWILCRSKRFPGRLYFFNVLNGEATWSSDELEHKMIQSKSFIQQADKWHSYPEPDGSPADDDAWMPFQSQSFGYQVPTVFGQAIFPKYPTNAKNYHSNMMRSPMSNQWTPMSYQPTSMNPQMIDMTLPIQSQTFQGHMQSQGHIQDQNMLSQGHMQSKIRHMHMTPAMHSMPVQMGPMTSQTAQMGGMTPQMMSRMGRMTPQVGPMTSQTGQIRSQMGQMTPQMKSQMGRMTPQMGPISSQINQMTPQMCPITPQVTPKIGQMTPQISQITPQMGQMTNQMTPQMGPITSQMGPMTPQMLQMTSQIGQMTPIMPRARLNKPCGNNNYWAQEQNSQPKFVQYNEGPRQWPSYHSVSTDKAMQGRNVFMTKITQRNLEQHAPAQAMEKKRNLNLRFSEYRADIPQVFGIPKVNVVRNQRSVSLVPSRQDPGLMRKILLPQEKIGENGGLNHTKSHGNLTNNNEDNFVNNNKHEYYRLQTPKEAKLITKFTKISNNEETVFEDQEKKRLNQRDPFAESDNLTDSNENVTPGKHGNTASTQTSIYDEIMESKSLKNMTVLDDKINLESVKDEGLLKNVMSDQVKQQNSLEKNDLRLKLLAKRNKPRAEQQEQKQEVNKIKTHYTDEYKPQPKPKKKRIRFNLQQDDEDLDEDKRNDSQGLDDNDNTETSDEHHNEGDHSIKALRDLGSITKGEPWFIVVDTDVLIEDYEFIMKFVSNDPTCFLLIPDVVRREIEAVSRGDHCGGHRVLRARKLCREFTDLPPCVRFQDPDFEFMMDYPVADSIINCCLHLYNESQHAVFVTSNEDLFYKALDSNVNSRFINDIKAEKPEVSFEFRKIQIQDDVEKMATSHSKERSEDSRRILDDNNNCEPKTRKETHFSFRLKYDKMSSDDSPSINMMVKYDTFKPDDSYGMLKPPKLLYNETLNESEVITTKGVKQNENGNEIEENTTFENQPDEIQIQKEDEETMASRVKKIKRINVYTVAGQIRKFKVQSDVIGERIASRLDEWMCTFTQIMEDALTEILQQNKLFVSLNAPPWTLLEALHYVMEVFDEDDHSPINALVDKLTQTLPQSSNGKPKQVVSAHDFMKILGCGILLIKYLNSIMKPSCSELYQTEGLLLELLEVIEEPVGRDDDVSVTVTLGRNDADSNVTNLEHMKRKNYMKRPAEVVEYLQRHFPAWRGNGRRTGRGNTAVTSEYEIDYLNVIQEKNVQPEKLQEASPKHDGAKASKPIEEPKKEPEVKLKTNLVPGVRLQNKAKKSDKQNENIDKKPNEGQKKTCTETKIIEEPKIQQPKVTTNTVESTQDVKESKNNEADLGKNDLDALDYSAMKEDDKNVADHRVYSENHFGDTDDLSFCTTVTRRLIIVGDFDNNSQENDICSNTNKISKDTISKEPLDNQTQDDLNIFLKELGRCFTDTYDYVQKTIKEFKDVRSMSKDKRMDVVHKVNEIQDQFRHIINTLQCLSMKGETKLVITGGKLNSGGLLQKFLEQANIINEQLVYLMSLAENCFDTLPPSAGTSVILPFRGANMTKSAAVDGIKQLDRN